MLSILNKTIQMSIETQKIIENSEHITNEEKQQLTILINESMNFYNEAISKVSNFRANKEMNISIQDVERILTTLKENTIKISSKQKPISEVQKEEKKIEKAEDQKTEKKEEKKCLEIENNAEHMQKEVCKESAIERMSDK